MKLAEPSKGTLERLSECVAKYFDTIGFENQSIEALGSPYDAKITVKPVVEPDLSMVSLVGYWNFDAMHQVLSTKMRSYIGHPTYVSHAHSCPQGGSVAVHVQ